MSQLPQGDLDRLEAYWRAANYLAVGQIYLQENPLLREPLKPEHIEPWTVRSLGHEPWPEPHLRPPQPPHP